MFWKLDFQSGFLDAQCTAHFQVVTPARALVHVMFCNLGLRCRYYHFLIRRRRKATLRCAEFNPQLHVVRILNSCARSRIWVCSTVLQNCGDWEWPSVSDLWTQRDGDEVWASRTDFNCSIKRLPPRTPRLCRTVTTRSPSSRLHHRDLAVPRVVGSRIRRRTRAGVVMC